MVKKNPYNRFLRTAGTGQYSRPEGAGNFDNMDDYNFVKSINPIEVNTKHIKASGTISGAYFYGDATGLYNVPPATESDPYWSAQSGAYLKIADESWPSQSGAYLKIANESWPAQSGAYLKIADESWPKQSGAYALAANLTALSGMHSATSGAVATNISNITYLSGAHATTSGAVATNASNITTLESKQTALSGSHNVLSGAYYAHAADSSDPHGVTLTQTNVVATGVSGATILVTGDHTSSGAAFVPNIVYDKTSGGMTASDYPRGTVMVVYDE